MQLALKVVIKEGDKMIYLNAFIFCGLVCVLGQLLVDIFKLTPGHVTSWFVVVGAILDSFNLYDKIVKFAGGGASTNY